MGNRRFEPVIQFSYESVFEQANILLENNKIYPDAIFAFNDNAAMTFILAFRLRGILIPEDVSIVGYNDIAPTRYFNPPISTVRQDPYQAGKLLVKKLMEKLDSNTPESEVIKTELIVRET